jgi:hypothetical protein
MPDQSQLDQWLKVLSAVTGIGTVVGWFALEWSWDIALYALSIAAVVGLVWTSAYVLRGGFKGAPIWLEAKRLLRSKELDPEDRVRALRLKREASEMLQTAAIWGPGLTVLAAVAARDIVESLRDEDPGRLGVAAGLGGLFALLLAWRGGTYVRNQARNARHSRMPCPDCCERIPVDAHVCRFCGYRLDGDVPRHWA